MKPVIRFYSRSNHVSLQVSCQGDKYRRSTGISLEGHTWNKERQRINGRTPYADDMNRLIGQLEDAVLSAGTYKDAVKEVDAIISANKSTEPVCETMLEYLEKYIAEVAASKSKSTRYIYDAVHNMYSTFVDEYEDIEIDSFDIGAIPTNKRASVIKRYFNHWISFNSAMIEEGLMPSTRKVYMAKINAVRNWIETDFGVSMPKKYPDIKVVSDNVALPREAVKQFMQMDKYYDNDVKMSVYLLCKIQLCTALRLEDAARLTMDDFIDYNGTPYVMEYNQKTGRKTINRIHPNVMEEIEKKGFGDNIYSHKFRPPVKRTTRHKQVVKYMREIFKEIPIMHSHVMTVEQQPNGHWQQEKRSYLSLLHNHMLRTSAITWYSNEGVNEKNIKASSGHSANSPVYNKVYDLTVDSVFDMEVGLAQDRFYD